MPTQMQQVKSLEVAVLRLMETNQNRHDFAEGQATGPPPLAGAVGQEPAMLGRQEHPAEIVDVTEQVF